MNAEEIMKGPGLLRLVVIRLRRFLAIIDFGVFSPGPKSVAIACIHDNICVFLGSLEA